MEKQSSMMNSRLYWWSRLLPIVLFILCTNADLFSQTGPASNPNGLLPNIITGSTEAASLGKFGDWPVSEYTGVPNISIPLYSIKIKDLEIPVQLSYHAGGVKVDEIGSWVGTGWSLNAGGAVTRTIVGLADDDDGGIINQYRQGKYIKKSYDLNNIDDYVFFRSVADQQIDVEPDLYYYNFLGNAGKFCFDSAGNFHAIPANSLKVVQPAFTGLAGNAITNTEWIMADAKGNTFYFGSNDNVNGGANGVERTYSGVVPFPIDAYKITSWYITKIIAANRADTIYFDYNVKLERFTLPPVISYKYLTNETSLPYDDNIYNPQFGISGWKNFLDADVILYNGSSSPNHPVLESLATGASTLKRIRWRGGEVDFSANTFRQDISNTNGLSNMLDSVNVYNSSGGLVKSFGLKYSYLQQRYFLDSIIEFGQGKVPNLKHGFDYISPQYLPVSTSLTGIASVDQDHWGYYNGAGNTYSLPPVTSVPGLATDALTANREPDTVRMQYGTLNKIIYPTGGSTLFEYESNRYDPSTTAGGYGPPTPVIKAHNTVQCDIVSPYNRLVFFTVPFTQNNISIAITIHNYGHPPQKNMAWMPYVIFGNQTSSGFQQQYYGDAYDNFPASGVTPNADGLYDYNYTVSNLTMTGGSTYSLIVSDTCLKWTNCADYPYPMPVVTATISYLTYAPPPAGGGVAPLPIAGGLRIKQITNYNNNNNFIGKKVYTYAPGNLLTYPTYLHHYQYDVDESLNKIWLSQNPGGIPRYYYPTFADFQEETSTSQVILGFTQSAPVGYTQVTEKEVDEQNNDKGYTDNRFSFFADSLNIYNFDLGYWARELILNPAMPANNFDFKRGLLLSKDTYKKNADNTYVKIHSLTNDYNFNDYNVSNHYARIHALRLKHLRFVNYETGTIYGGYTVPSVNDYRSDFGYSLYDIITSWIQNSRTTEKLYDQNGQNPVTKITNTYYDNSQHLQPTRMVTTRSNQDSVISMTNYPQDYATGTPFIDSMVAHNLIATPIENINYTIDPSGNTHILGGKVMTFLPNGKGLLDKIKVMESASPVALSNFKFSNTGQGQLPYSLASKTLFSPDSRYVDKVGIAGYDPYANTLEQSKVGDAKHSYVWDYANLYPVAEAINAAQSDIAYTSFEADGTGNWTVGSTARDTTTAITGNNSYILNNDISKSGLNPATTYIVSYWTLNRLPFYIAGTIPNYPTKGKTINGWTLYVHKVTGQTTISISNHGYIDELRLYPAGAQMTTYTYTPLVGMTSQCDMGNRVTYYEYDGLQRLKRIRDQDHNILKTFDYQYGIKQ
jgi:hypothetical protein